MGAVGTTQNPFSQKARISEAAGCCGNKWTEYEVVRRLLTFILSQQGHCLQAALQEPPLPGFRHEFITAASGPQEGPESVPTMSTGQGVTWPHLVSRRKESAEIWGS